VTRTRAERTRVAARAIRMSFEDRIENLYLAVWRAVVLSVATIALIASITAGAAAVRSIMAEPPVPPAPNRPEERDEALMQAVTLEKFKLVEHGGPAPWPGGATARGSGEPGAADAVRRISRNLDEYVKNAFPAVAPVPEATEWTVEQVMKGLDLRSDAERRVYLATLEALSEQLLRAAPEQSKLPEERRIDPHRVLRWHAGHVERFLRSIEEENERRKNLYEQRLTDYANRQTRILGYLGIAGGALAVFVAGIFLFVIIRIERDLRTMAIASLATTRRLEG